MKKLLLLAAACVTLSSLTLFAEQTFKEDSEPVITDASVEANSADEINAEPIAVVNTNQKGIICGSDPRTYTPKWLLDGAKYQGGRPRHGGVIVGPIPTDTTTENNE